MNFTELQELVDNMPDKEKRQWAECYKEERIKQLIESNGLCGIAKNYPSWGSISEMRFYLNTLEEFIETQRQQYAEQLKQDAQKLPENKRAGFFAWHYDPRPTETLSNILRASFLVSLCSYFEVCLDYFCEDVTTIACPSEKYSKYGSQKVKRAKKFSIF